MSQIAAQPGDVLPSASGVLAARPRSLWRDAWSRLRRNRLALLALATVSLYVLVALVGFTGVLSTSTGDISDPNYRASLIERTMATSNAPPTAYWPGTHRLAPSLWFGTDFLGRSVFWRFLYGARVALTVAALAALVSSIIGIVLGILAGYFGGWVDAIIVWLFSTISSVPWILLMIALAFVLKDQEFSAWLFGKQRTFSLTGIPTIVLALGLTSWVGLCRLIRGEVLKHRSQDYVTAARSLGLNNGRILFRHILPNVFHLVIIDFSLGLSAFVQSEVVLSFLGLGITDQPSWGRMIDDAKLELLKAYWWQFAAATVAIFVFSLAVNILGDALRDALDPRLRGVD